MEVFQPESVWIKEALETITLNQEKRDIPWLYRETYFMQVIKNDLSTKIKKPTSF